jgi:hypothetical protein
VQDIDRIDIYVGCSTSANLSSHHKTIPSLGLVEDRQPTEKRYLSGYSNNGPDAFKVENQGGRSGIKSSLSDNSAWLAEISTRDVTSQLGRSSR